MQSILVSAGRSGGPTPFMCPRRMGSGLSNASSSSSLNEGDPDTDSYSFRQPPPAPAQSLSTRAVYSAERDRDRGSFERLGSFGAGSGGSVGASPSTYSSNIPMGTTNQLPLEDLDASASATAMASIAALASMASTGSATSGPAHVRKLSATGPQRKFTPVNRPGTSGTGTGGSGQSGSALLETVYLYGTPTMPRKPLYQRL